MASNHGNLYNELLALVQGRYRVLHTKANVTGAGVGEGNGTAGGAGWRRGEGKGETMKGR